MGIGTMGLGLGWEVLEGVLEGPWKEGCGMMGMEAIGVGIGYFGG